MEKLYNSSEFFSEAEITPVQCSEHGITLSHAVSMGDYTQMISQPFFLKTSSFFSATIKVFPLQQFQVLSLHISDSLFSTLMHISEDK